MAVVKSTPRTFSPVRIYVLWHPDFGEGLRLARRIYYWFRLETGEGIPVFFRSQNAPGKSAPPALPHDPVINYLIPLVDANMVACPRWRHQVIEWAQPPQSRKGPTNRIFPVALDPVSYQMPAELRKLNFIRHIHHEDQPPDDEVLLGRLTEVICRDLRDRLIERRAGRGKPNLPGKLKIFLSHAKADGTRTPIRLKEFIQGQTQCDAFFDENDIPSGAAWADILDQAVRADSAGLIVVQGDHYSDRPWCRKEVRDFLTPQREDAFIGSAKPAAFFTPPVVLVQDMAGKKLAHAIPELGHAPCLRWSDGNERQVVITLIREVLFGLFYRQIALELAQAEPIADKDGPITVYLNRRPDPVLVQRVFSMLERPVDRLVYPGYGLSQMDRLGLETAFPGIGFTSFFELSTGQGPLLREVHTANAQKPLLAVSAGNASDILASGASDEHNRELLFRILKPLFTRQFSVLYGGRLPEIQREKPRWDDDVNFTEVFVYLLLSERDERHDRNISARGRKNPTLQSRLYNISAWPESAAVDTKTIAQWTDVCSFLPVSQSDAGISETLQCRAGDEADHSIQRAVNKALCLTAMRKRAVGRLRYTLPDHGGKHTEITTVAHLFIGGRTVSSTGSIPGIFEELLYAMEAGKPIYLIGCGMGATGHIARWLANRPPQCPPELTARYYARRPGFRDLQAELAKFRPVWFRAADRSAAVALPGWQEVETADSTLTRLWQRIRDIESDDQLPELLRNGLDVKENKELLTCASYTRIAELVHKGIANLFPDPPPELRNRVETTES